jgi:hypothetical protein
MAKQKSVDDLKAEYESLRAQCEKFDAATKTELRRREVEHVEWVKARKTALNALIAKKGAAGQVYREAQDKLDKDAAEKARVDEVAAIEGRHRSARGGGRQGPAQGRRQGKVAGGGGGEGAGISGVKLMGLIDDIAASDMSAFLDSDLMPGVESVTYTPKGGAARTIKANVFRFSAERIPGSVAGFAPYAELVISRDATLGVPTVTVGGDKVAIAVREGGSTQTYTISDIVNQDSASWTLRVNVNG